MRTRLSLLAVTVGLAIVAVACGRATQEQIDAALGITPTVTLSAEQIATGTAAAASVEQTRTAALAMMGSPGAGQASFADIGDVTQGSVQYRLRCLNCHRANSPSGAPLLQGPDNPAVAFSDQQLVDLVRTAEGHADPPGPLLEVTISERQLINIIAYIRDQSK